MSTELTIDRRLSVGDLVEPFELADPHGRLVAVDPATSAVTVVVFTSSGCPYALAWHDRLQDIARDYAGRDVRVVQVFSNDPELQPADRPEALVGRLQNGELAGETLVDAQQAQAQRWGATATPEVFVVDRDRVVRYHGAPDADFEDPERRAEWVREALDSVLDGGTVERPKTSPVGCSIKWRVRLLWWDGCPSHDDAERLLRSVLSQLGRSDVAVSRTRVSDLDEATTRAFPGSPSFQVGGRDLFPSDAEPALGCRVYRGEGGRVGPLPDADQLRARLQDALARPWDLPGWTDFRRS